MSSTKSSPRDFSLFSLFTAGLACLVPFANAYTKPVGAEPVGNPIYEPGLNSIVPAGENFTITWGPTTQGTVTLVLLKGPSTNAIPQYAIVEKIPNSGSYAWFVSTDLAPSADATGYGIQLINDENGQYQYSTQFGISNPDYKPVLSSTSSSSSASETASTTKTVSITKSASVSTTTASATISETVTLNSTTASIHYTTNSTITVPRTTGLSASTGGLPANGSIVYPTGSMTVPSTLSGSRTGGSSATGSAIAPIQTGAASGMATSLVGLVVAAGVAVFAL